MGDRQRSTPTSDIKSRPDYGVLQPILHGDKNLVIAEGIGIHAVLRMYGEAPADFAGRSTLLYAETGSSANHELECLRVLGLKDIDVVPEADEALRYLERLLDQATMGTNLYTTGGESFIGQVVRLAIDHRLHHTSIVTELSGSLARRVQCVHCKYTAVGITQSIYECPGCGLSVFVRDHYSRRLAAFQAVCVNAEDPNELIEAQEAYR